MTKFLENLIEFKKNAFFFPENSKLYVSILWILGHLGCVEIVDMATLTVWMFLQKKYFFDISPLNIQYLDIELYYGRWDENLFGKLNQTHGRLEYFLETKPE